MPPRSMNLQKPRIISKDDATQCQVWDLPAMDGPITAGIGRDLTSPLTAKDLQDIYDRAYQEGFEFGRRDVTGVFVHVQFVAVDVGDFFDVFRAQAVLVFTFFVFAVGVDE